MKTYNQALTLSALMMIVGLAGPAMANDEPMQPADGQPAVTCPEGGTDCDTQPIPEDDNSAWPPEEETWPADDNSEDPAMQ
ncbi:hypothetical protein BZG76_01360 [Salinivibrio sp. AR647]|uniref:hypothetical protein n=1 Tax=unclassified Salinivibrio TaxID=2636825 RepID=UPI000985C594|nr:MULTISPECIES: hypothetical protein [unclassified Salinivibrio]NUY57243.1 hypothetical protein [Salinivibrio sp. EAGSL]OOE94336.1 hypothetical protein BZG76_01360 [Salinivibrio sp. AR647]